MSADPVDLIARTLLYEGYLLYPYRPSAVKNQQRFNFGVLYPQPYVQRGGRGASGPAGNESWQLQTECPVRGHAGTRIEASVRFLQLIERQAHSPFAAIWHEAIEREISIGVFTIADLRRAKARAQTFGIPALPGTVDPAHSVESAVAVVASEDGLRAEVNISLEEVRTGAYKLRVCVSNLTSLESAEASREQALLRSLVSAHVILRTADGELVSLLDPPDAFRDIAAGCVNVGVWPVLVGNDGDRELHARVTDHPLRLSANRARECRRSVRRHRDRRDPGAAHSHHDRRRKT